MQLETQVENAQIARQLEEIGTLLELKEDNPFRARAYHNAARVVEGITDDIALLAEDGRLDATPGLGKDMRALIREYLSSGRIAMLDQLAATIPPGLITMLRIPGLGPKRIRLLNETLGIATIEALTAACQENKVAAVAGFGAKSQEKILKGIEFLSQHQDAFNYAVALPLAEATLAAILGVPGVLRAEIGGSLRRKKEIVHDIDAVCSVADDAARVAVMQLFVTLPEVTEILGHGDTKSSVICNPGIQMDLRVVNDDEYAAALHHFTGSKDHHIELRNLALERGIKINDYGLWRGEERLPMHEESDVYAVLGMDYIPPEMREARGEIAAAQAHALPRLLTREDMRGVLHCHTTYSDGHATLRDMAEAARKRGYAYIGICDHSQVAAYAHGLSPDRVRRQQEEIDALNAEYAGEFVILKGTECDILKDGALDFADDTLALFDFVVASIHSNFNLDEAAQTERLIRAINHPYTTFIGHPTGRILLGREGYPVDIPRVIAAAGRRGVGIELNCNPARFDLDWRWHKLATELHVPVPLSPDAHEPAGLDDIPFGIGIARKGWLGPDDVPNAWPVDRLRAWFADVRQRGGAPA
jgi:DNA polymerase (family 10)